MRPAFEQAVEILGADQAPHQCTLQHETKARIAAGVQHGEASDERALPDMRALMRELRDVRFAGGPQLDQTSGRPRRATGVRIHQPLGDLPGEIDVEMLKAPRREDDALHEDRAAGDRRRWSARSAPTLPGRLRGSVIATGIPRSRADASLLWPARLSGRWQSQAFLCTFRLMEPVDQGCAPTPPLRVNVGSSLSDRHGMH
jgi:hypothetical protein